MDIGDIGFLIIAFIVFIANYFVKANKEKTEAQAKTQAPPIPDIYEPKEEESSLPPLFESPFKRESLDEPIKVEPPKTFTPSTYSNPFNNIDTQMDPTQEGLSSMSASLFKEDNMDSISYQDEGMDEQISYTNELFHGRNISEELKKAVIYSEILTRKYE